MRSIRFRPRGAAYLMLVVILLLVIVGATKTLVVGEVSTRRSESASRRAKTLLVAIDRVLDTDVSPDSVVRLPLDPNQDAWVVVETTTDTITARWSVGDRVHDQVVRPLPSTLRRSVP